MKLFVYLLKLAGYPASFGIRSDIRQVKKGRIIRPDIRCIPNLDRTV
jgi:hypothetical protein